MAKETTARPIAASWEIASVVTTSIALIGLAFIASQLWHVDKILLQRMDASISRSDSILVELYKLNAPPVVHQLSEVENHCSGWENTFQCTFTNPTPTAVATCAGAQLSRRDDPQAKVQSATLCSGRIGPFESKTVSAPWLGKNASDVCFTKSPWGGTRLDWRVCDFQVIGLKQ